MPRLTPSYSGQMLRKPYTFTKGHPIGSSFSRKGSLGIAMSATVFVSYSSADAALANSIYTFLNQHGIRALKAPEDIRPGQDWAGSIAAMIDDATHMVLIWTSGSMASKEVAKELTLAMQSNTVIIPFQVEDLAPAGAWRYHLANLHWLQAHNTDHDTARQSLLDQIKGIQPAIVKQPIAPRHGTKGAAALIALALSIGVLLLNLLALVVGLWFGLTQPTLQAGITILIGSVYRAIPPFSMALYLTSLVLAITALVRRRGSRAQATWAIALSAVQLLAYGVGAVSGLLPR